MLERLIPMRRSTSGMRRTILPGAGLGACTSIGRTADAGPPCGLSEWTFAGAFGEVSAVAASASGSATAGGARNLAASSFSKREANCLAYCAEMPKCCTTNAN